MKKRKTKTEKRKSLSQKVITFSGFALVVAFLANIFFNKPGKIPLLEEIILILITLIGISFFIQGWLRIRRITIYDIFYSSYIAFTIVILTIVYWISYLNNIDVEIFRALIVLTLLIAFVYSLIASEHSDKMIFIIISYAFTVIMSIVLFAYLYWTLSIFGMGHLQFSDCSADNPALRSENWFYFSSVTFYSLGYGDICPVNTITRLLSQIQVALGVLINTILIGFIFWKMRETT